MATTIDDADAVVFICRACETEYAPEIGECPECGDWAFTAALSPSLLPVPRATGGGS